MTDKHKRVFGLDVFRATAIILVLMSHTISLIGTKVIMDIFYVVGVIGVELFFVLSGFLIGIILIKLYHTAPVISFESIKVFWIRRWFRTLPNYYLMLIVYIFMFSYLNHKNILTKFDTLLYFGFLQNFFSEIKESFFGVSWSLSIEEWFYIFFPALLFGSQRFFKNKQKAIFTLIIIFIAFPFLTRTYFEFFGRNIGWDTGYRKIVPLRLDGIAMGVLAAYFKYYYDQQFNKYKNLFFSIGLVFLLLLIVFFYYATCVHSTVSMNIIKATVFFTLFSLSIALLIPFIYKLNDSNLNKIFLLIIRNISIISYSMYLLHPIIIIFVLHFFIIYNVICKILLMWILTLISGYIQYCFFEQKITRLREFYSKSSTNIIIN
ncbi:acyltransferase family protein [Mucilaginibacter boryungensis]|uniref:Acyltransferase n=1 Tax=Mucilaginibacter boryungensis TaxID=768480 RepID=A0ABR9XIF4_9SPHI|nr:acyltransferase [Mucilaginibacter boryungensis]MBE9666864.1 acyltransferase [Mucilaginibacter boryungensis]